MRERAAQPAPDFAGTDETPQSELFMGAELGRAPMLPEPCPVTPLGVEGNKLWLLDGLNQIQLVATKCDKGDLMLMFGHEWLETYFDTEGKERWDQRKVQTALIADCRARGIFNPTGKVFGRGAHRYPGDPATLALHMGTRVLLANAPGPEGRRMATPQQHPPGRMTDADRREAYFPALGRLPFPAKEAAGHEEGDALLALIKRWYWVEAEAAPLLLLGWIGQGFFCGALDWRSHVWLAAPTASGKSELQKLIRALLDDWCLHTEDASEAAIRQTLGDDKLAVMIDEAEAHDRPERLQAILNLMKKSSSGAKMHRGSVDHKAQEFTVHSAFLLSSVLHASMRGEDRNRIAILEMRSVPPDAKALDLDLLAWRQAGRRFHARLLAQWPRFDRTLQLYKAAIARRRYEGRWGDTYGTLLACADLLLYDFAPDDAVIVPDGHGLERIEANVAIVAGTIQRGRAESRSDVDRVLVHIASQLIPGAGGKAPESVGLWIDRAMMLEEVPGQHETDYVPPRINQAARDRLKSYGLRVVNVEPVAGRMTFPDATPEQWDKAYLAVAYATNKGIAELFKTSAEWTGGGYLQSLGKVPGAIKTSPQKIRFTSSMSSDYALLVPLSAFREDE